MKRNKVILIFLLLSLRLWATHNRAGEITYRWIGGSTFEVTITTYTRLSSLADRCDVTVYFGDGDSAVFIRNNGNTYLKCGNTIPDGQIVGDDIKKNIYSGTHTYPGSGTYHIWMQDPNRVEAVKNIPNSVNVPFAIKTMLVINPLLGSNSSPVLLNPPIDNACQGVCFYHNPGAYDPDGDSLSYKLVTCLGLNGSTVPGYSLPATSGTFFIDALTGDLEWCSPIAPGIYNAAILIEEWRIFNGKRYLIGNVLRDMQIDVDNNCNSLPPVIENILDTCIEAGKFLTFTVTAIDPDGDYLTLSASGGPMSSVLAPKAIFNPVSGGAYVFGIFKWQTSCDHIRKQPYMVTFKAADIGPPSLVDFETMKITVVAPAPKNPSATPLGSSMKIKWNKSICDPINNIFSGYKIYRKASPSGWNPGYCETGVPDYAGYSLIGKLNIINGYSIADTSFTDNDNGAGLVQGVTYCYRIVACFQDGAESYASVEICAELKKDVPIITNVDVITTGTNDTVFIRWVKPIANTNNFDTIAHPGPYTFELYQSYGFNLYNPILIKTYTSATFNNWMDTTYKSPNLNTRDTAYSYRINFYAQNYADTIGFSRIASSVYLSLTPSDNQLTLNWQSNVPWNNYKYYIYKNIPPSITYSLYDSTIAPQYVDNGLVNGAEYCYYVLTKGEYSDATLPKPLFNRSERVCGFPEDKIAPCSPVLSIIPDCIEATNTLTWNNPNNFCSDDAVKYNIYYTPVQSEPFSLLLTVNNINDTTYTYSDANSIAGCFLVTAVDSFANESTNGTMFCVDNCPIYELPNVFTPDGDGANDYFNAILPYRFIKDVSMKIFNRWGQLMYETTNPNINWNGKNKYTGQICSDGTYYYVCTVNEIRVYGIQPREIKGFLQLISGKNSGPNK